MTKQVQLALKKLPYYNKIVSKGRYKGVKAKAWSIFRDFVRIRDFVKYHSCVATGHRIEDWKECDAGHFITMGGHGAQLGFSVMNVHAQSKNSNRQSGADEGADFERELVVRYGQNMVNKLRRMKQDPPIKADDFFFIKKIQEVYKLFQELKKDYPDFDYPEYVNKSY